jgi:DNA-binding transcriptional ArsR family regulator
MHSTATATATTFQTLADPTRLRIVEALRGGERAVNDLVERMDIHQSGVSRHLRILSEAGFVRVRPDGPRRLYSLRPEPFRELDAWVAGFRELWEARLDRFARELERRQKARAAARQDKARDKQKDEEGSR